MLDHRAVIRLLNAAKQLLAATIPQFPESREMQYVARDELRDAIADVEASINPKT